MRINGIHGGIPAGPGRVERTGNPRFREAVSGKNVESAKKFEKLLLEKISNSPKAVIRAAQFPDRRVEELARKVQDPDFLTKDEAYVLAEFILRQINALED